MEKKKKNLGEFIKSYKKDYRVRLKVKLILFILFMGPLMIFLLYANSKTENGLMGSIEKETITTTTEKIKKTYKQVLDTYKETYNKIKISSTGEKEYIIDYTETEELSSGTIETSDGIIKFNIRDKYPYEVKMGEEIQNVTLLEDKNEIFLNKEKLVTLLLQNSKTPKNTEDGTYYIYNNLTINEDKYNKIEVLVKDEKLVKIYAQTDKNEINITIE